MTETGPSANKVKGVLLYNSIFEHGTPSTEIVEVGICLRAAHRCSKRARRGDSMGFAASFPNQR